MDGLKPLILDLVEPVNIICHSGDKVFSGFTSQGTWTEPDSGGADT